MDFSSWASDRSGYYVETRGCPAEQWDYRFSCELFSGTHRDCVQVVIIAQFANILIDYLLRDTAKL